MIHIIIENVDETIAILSNKQKVKEWCNDFLLSEEGIPGIFRDYADQSESKMTIAIVDFDNLSSEFITLTRKTTTEYKMHSHAD